jgi:hypothetical protein
MKKKEVQVELIEKPAHSFCERCKNSDTRIHKDTLNTLYLTVTQLSDYFNFEGKIDTKCKKLIDWMRRQQKMESKRVTKNSKVSS